MERQAFEHVVRGGDLLKADRVDEALAELVAASALEPGDARILGLLGLVYFRLERLPDARTIYRDLVERQPEDAGLRLNLGLVHLKVGDLDDALRELGAARDLEPQHSRIYGYLGLALARKGAYADARDAFMRAGQDELAREMEGYLSGAAPAPATEAEDLPDRPEPEPERDSETASPSEPDSVAGSDSVAAPVAEPPAPVTSNLVLPAPAASPPPAAASSRALTLAPLPAVKVPDLLPTTLPSVSTFATARLIRPDDGTLPFEITAGDALIVRVRGRLLSRTRGVALSGGSLSYERAARRTRGSISTERFGPDEDPVYAIAGHGHLVALPRGRSFAAMQLLDDIVYIREDLVFAFEDSLGWENGHVPGADRRLPFVQLRGEGSLAIRSRRATLSVKLAPSKVLYVNPGVFAGWIGRVIPRVILPRGGGARVVECTGEGVVLLEEPPEVTA